jgi:hypothetical protein
LQRLTGWMSSPWGWMLTPSGVMLIRLAPIETPDAVAAMAAGARETKHGAYENTEAEAANCNRNNISQNP